MNASITGGASVFTLVVATCDCASKRNLCVCVQGLDTLPLTSQPEARKFFHRLFASEFGEDSYKLVDCGWHTHALFTASDSTASTGAGTTTTTAAASVNLRSGETLHLVRTVCSFTPRGVVWRGHRSYMTVQDMEFEENGSAGGEGSEATGSLRIYGYLRGRPLNVHQLICLPSGGVYQMDFVVRARDLLKSSTRTPTAASGASGVVEDSPASVAALGSAPGSVYVSLRAAVGTCTGHIRLATSHAEWDEETKCVPTPEFQESLEVVAAVEATGDAEQTWPVAADEDVGPNYGGKRMPAAAGAKFGGGGMEAEDDADDHDGHDHDDAHAGGGGGGGVEARSTHTGRTGGSSASKRRPKGMSAFQASWLVGDEEDESGEEYTDGESEGDDGDGDYGTQLVWQLVCVVDAGGVVVVCHTVVYAAFNKREWVGGCAT